MPGYLAAVPWTAKWKKYSPRRTSYLTNKKRLYRLRSVSIKTTRNEEVTRYYDISVGRGSCFSLLFECSRHFLESFITGQSPVNRLRNSRHKDAKANSMFDQSMNNQLPFGKQTQTFCSVVSPSYFKVLFFVNVNRNW